MQINEDLVWVFDTYGDDVLSGPYSSEQAAYDDIKVMTSRNSAGERIECSEPYQMERSKLKELVMKEYGNIYEAMSEKGKKEFYAKLATEKVHFQYHKLNGELRKAYGTLIPEELPTPKKKTDTKQEARDKMHRKFPKDSALYYDLEDKHFKSFKIRLFDKYLEK